MPPTNITAATAIVVPSLPYSNTLNITGLVPDGSGNIDLWYAYTAIAGDNVIGGLSKKTVFTTAGDGPWTQVYLGPASAPVSYLASVSATNGREQVPVTPGTTYYWVSRWDGGADTFSEDFSLYRFTDGTIPNGSILINSDEPGYPAAFVDPATGNPLAWQQTLTAGETGDLLPSGRLLLFDTDAGDMKLYQQAATNRFTLLTTVAVNGNVGAGNGVDRFYAIADTGGTGRAIQAIEADGTLGTSWTLPAAGVGFIPVLCAVSPDESIAYINNNITEGEIRRWDLVNDLPLSNLVAGVTNFNLFAATISPGCLKVLRDGTIIAGYWNNALNQYFLRHYSAAGATLATWTFTGTALLDRLCLDLTTETFVWVWGKSAFGIGSFYKVTVADGTITLIGSGPEVQDGGAMKLRASEEVEEFGIPFSCPFFVLPTVTTTQTFTIRRQRRWLAPSSQDNKFMQIPTLEILMRTGIGLTPAAWGNGNDPQGADPQVMYRFSKNGGKTWGPERWASAGQIGDFVKRLRFLRATGNYRSGVFELTFSDPVDWQLIAALGDPIEGSS